MLVEMHTRLKDTTQQPAQSTTTIWNWWRGMAAVSAINVFVAGYLLHRAHGTGRRACVVAGWLAFVYVVVCAFRSVLPRIDNALPLRHARFHAARRPQRFDRRRAELHCAHRHVLVPPRRPSPGVQPLRGGDRFACRRHPPRARRRGAGRRRRGPVLDWLPHGLRAVERRRGDAVGRRRLGATRGRGHAVRRRLDVPPSRGNAEHDGRRRGRHVRLRRLHVQDRHPHVRAQVARPQGAEQAADGYAAVSLVPRDTAPIRQPTATRA